MGYIYRCVWVRITEYALSNKWIIFCATVTSFMNKESVVRKKIFHDNQALNFIKSPNYPSGVILF